MPARQELLPFTGGNVVLLALAAFALLACGAAQLRIAPKPSGTCNRQ